MTDQPTIWHNPRCSKSRQTLAVLEAAGFTPVVRKYLQYTPSRAELNDVHAMLGRPVIDFTRTGEKAFAEAGLTKDSGDDALLAAMVAAPILIERPIVIHKGRAALGRPPEAVKDIL